MLAAHRTSESNLISTFTIQKADESSPSPHLEQPATRPPATWSYHRGFTLQCILLRSSGWKTGNIDFDARSAGCETTSMWHGRSTADRHVQGNGDSKLLINLTCAFLPVRRRPHRPRVSLVENSSSLTLPCQRAMHSPAPQHHQHLQHQHQHLVVQHSTMSIPGPSRQARHCRLHIPPSYWKKPNSPMAQHPVALLLLLIVRAHQSSLNSSFIIPLEASF